MARPVEEHEQRVAAELQDVAAPREGDPDQPRVAAADRADQLLGTELPAHGEAFRERGEAGDVDPHE